MAARDAEATKQRILEATGRVLLRDGFQGLGINAVAKEAGVGKPLIYRYFGGMGALLEAFGRDADFWLGLDDILAGIDEAAPPGRYSDLIEHLLIGYARGLRARPALLEALRWELQAHNAITRRLEEGRERAALALLEHLRGGLQPPAGTDADAVNAILVAAVHYLAMRASVREQFVGVGIDGDDDWHRLERALADIIQKVYAKPAI